MSITKEYTIWCDRCSKWHQESWARIKASFKKMMQKDGWRLEGKKTLCPDCASKEPRAKDHGI